MCSINAIINIHGQLDNLTKMKVHHMHKATERRGIRKIVQENHNAIVAFNWLPITDDSLGYLPNEHNGTIVYLNGYISNYKELASKYDIELKTDSDIEFLAKFIDQCNGNYLDELNGFFAVLYYSPIYKSWNYFTDRYGAKQLYIYTDSKANFYISSEVKGILSINPEIELDENSIEDWKCTLGVMNRDTIYKGIFRCSKLPFNIPEKIQISYEDAKNKLISLLNQSFERNKIENEPSGVYLSGGIDSGIIAKWMKPKYSFSVDYEDDNYSEIELIKKNTCNNHMTIIVNEESAKRNAEKTMFALDDLKAGSCYTNFAIAELASKFVKVMYSGAGGDEFFGGYPHRKDKPIENVIARTDFALDLNIIPKNWNVSHFEYDLKFLSAVLVVEDRMSGYHTMETRYPLLDNDLVDFALSLPDDYLENKRILKDVSGLHEDVINGKKRGFSNPYFTNDEWVEFTLKNLKR